MKSLRPFQNLMRAQPLSLTFRRPHNKASVQPRDKTFGNHDDIATAMGGLTQIGCLVDSLADHGDLLKLRMPELGIVNGPA